MADETRSADPERIENLLRTAPFFRAASTRRTFMGRLLAVGSGVAVGGAIGGAALLRPLSAHANPDPVTDFGNAAVGAERIGISFYDNALGMLSPFGVPDDLAKGTLLNDAHRVYFTAARNQEAEHLAVLESLKLSFPFSTFSFPAGTFTSASSMLAFGEQLESIFIGAYLGAIKAAASVSNAFIAEAAAQIVGIECEHRVLIRDIAGANPPNDRWFEGDITTPDGSLGNTGSRSTVYATANDAVAALLALGITPS
ncbi:MAG TPA: ferritin-like domain-containing protein [Ktedonobacterales bacterium]|nr:ferritin-like domain-containing protein [Ktedonobacterales bacterium]